VEQSRDAERSALRSVEIKIAAPDHGRNAVARGPDARQNRSSVSSGHVFVQENKVERTAITIEPQRLVSVRGSHNFEAGVRERPDDESAQLHIVFCEQKPHESACIGLIALRPNVSQVPRLGPHAAIFRYGAAACQEKRRPGDEMGASFQPIL
jgi:hypothetical protein